jgi:cytochrome c556
MDARSKEKVAVGREKQTLSSDSDSSNLESSSDPELPFDAERAKQSTLSETSTSILSGWLSTAKGVFRSRRSTEIQQTSETLPEISEDDSDAGSALAPE